MLLGAGNGAMEWLEHSLEAAMTRSAPGAEDVVAQLGPRLAVRWMANAMRGDLPARVDEITEIVRVDADDEVLVFDYRVDTDLDTSLRASRRG